MPQLPHFRSSLRCSIVLAGIFQALLLERHAAAEMAQFTFSGPNPNHAIAWQVPSGVSAVFFELWGNGGQGNVGGTGGAGGGFGSLGG